MAEAGYLRYYEKKRTPPNVFGRVRFLVILLQSV